LAGLDVALIDDPIARLLAGFVPAQRAFEAASQQAGERIDCEIGWDLGFQRTAEIAAPVTRPWCASTMARARS
jgi:hypothetical protein